MSVFFSPTPLPDDLDLAELWHLLENDYFEDAAALAEFSVSELRCGHRVFLRAVSGLWRAGVLCRRGTGRTRSCRVWRRPLECPPRTGRCTVASGSVFSGAG